MITGERPDFTHEVFKSKQIWGYALEPDESLFWGTLTCMENPSPLMTTGRSPLAPGEEDYLINPVTGEKYAYIPPGYDLLFKGTLCNFDQPIRVEVIIEELGGAISVATFLPTEPSLVVSPIGATKSDIVGLDNPMTVRIKVKNIGNDYAVGRVQFFGLVKEGAYTWR